MQAEWTPRFIEAAIIAALIAAAVMMRSWDRLVPTIAGLYFVLKAARNWRLISDTGRTADLLESRGGVLFAILLGVALLVSAFAAPLAGWMMVAYIAGAAILVAPPLFIGLMFLFLAEPSKN